MVAGPSDGVCVHQLTNALGPRRSRPAPRVSMQTNVSSIREGWLEQLSYELYISSTGFRRSS
jgi:hypothetical protein